MALYITSLNSGSNGNCYYIGNEHDAVLIDAGISCRETERRMNKLGLSIKNVRAIFISHEHIDHIKGVSILSEKYNLPVYITKHTYNNSGITLNSSLINYLPVGGTININQLSIKAFSKIHDAIEPQSFVVTCNEVNVGVFTDIGRICDDVITHFQTCHAAFLETNYDVEMLDDGKYPIHLKNRIRSGKGHLSNTQALSLFQDHAPTYMTHLFLAHLSHNNNSPELAYNIFKAAAGQVNIIIAPRLCETGLYHITKTKNESPVYMTSHFTYQATLF